MKKITPFLWSIALVIMLSLGIYAGHSVTSAYKDTEIMRLEEQIGASRAQVRRARAIARRNKSVILAWDVVASYYTEASSGGTMANGQPFDEDLLTAAHRVLKFGTIVIVENLDNGKLSPVQIQDRGPYIAGRGLDVSKAVAERLGMVESGLARVRIYELIRGRPSEGD